MQNRDRTDILEQVEKMREIIDAMHNREAKNVFETINNLDGINNLIRSGMHNVENLCFKLQALNQTIQDTNQYMEILFRILYGQEEALDLLKMIQRNITMVADTLLCGDRITEDNASLFQKIMDAAESAIEAAHHAEVQVVERIESDEEISRQFHMEIVQESDEM